MQIVIAGIHVLLLAALSYWLSKKEAILKIYFWPALILKVGAGISLGLLYTYYYSDGDTFQYFEDGTKLAELAKADAKKYFAFLWSGNESFEVWTSLGITVPRALFMTKIVSIFCLITFNNYWIASLYFSFVSFCGAWILVRRIIVFSPSNKNAAIISLLFFPSVIFWSSGLIKESLAMASLFFLCSLFMKVWQRKSLKWIEGLLLVVSLWVLWNLKYYYLAVFMPVAITSLVFRFFVSDFLCNRNVFIKVGAWLLIFIVPLVVVSLVHPNFYPERFLEVIIENHDAYAQRSGSDKVILYFNLQPDILSVLINSPWALLSGLFRPFIWETNTVFQFLVAIENVFIVFLTIAVLFRWREWTGKYHHLLFFSIVSYVGVLCIFLALSAPNFGTLARYKVGFLPFFILLISVGNPLLNRVFSFYEGMISKAP
ncbi:MAG TPA: hypothetical protein PLS08_00835 [Chryseolinea sp.]|nr:hypothetical protein [Chryseolinea sp.]